MDSRVNALGRTLGAGVVAIALFNTVSALSKPVHEPHATVPQALTWLALLLVHGAVYFYGDQVRARFGVARYVAIQTALVLAVSLSGAFVPAGIALYFVLTIETVLLRGTIWGAASVTIAATVLFAINAVIAWDLYRGTTLGLMLAITGFMAHAVAGLVRARTRDTATSTVAPTAPAGAPSNGNHTLSARELQVLKAVVAGGRSSQIAAELSITERTVKAHLASIYQKLGVESRAAAVAAAVHRGLVS